MTKHTPGPWHYRKCPCGMPQCRIYTVSVKDLTEVTEFTEADARLAAASPDMLAALLALMENYEIVDGLGFNMFAVAKAHRAIAKATGE